MSYTIHRDGTLIERGDDATRKVYDGKGNTLRNYTPAENAATDAALAAEQQVQVQTQLRNDTTSDLDKLNTAITDLQTLLGDNATTGSIRSWRGSLTNTYKVTDLRALADLLINDAQATRRIARQTLRLAKVLAEDYTSADVGIE